VGIDGPSIDAWDASDFPSHKRLLGADVLILENLVLRHVVPEIYGLIAVPLNLLGPTAVRFALFSLLADSSTPRRRDRGAEDALLPPLDNRHVRPQGLSWRIISACGLTMAVPHCSSCKSV